MDPPVLSRAELLGLCLQVHGFPAESDPGQVAQRVTSVTRVPVHRLAPADVALSAEDVEKIWIIQFHCLEDRKTCYNQHRTFEAEYDGSRYEVTLQYPQLNYIPSPTAPEWTSAEPLDQEDEEEVQDMDTDDQSDVPSDDVSPVHASRSQYDSDSDVTSGRSSPFSGDGGWERGGAVSGDWGWPHGDYEDWQTWLEEHEFLGQGDADQDEEILTSSAFQAESSASDVTHRSSSPVLSSHQASESTGCEDTDNHWRPNPAEDSGRDPEPSQAAGLNQRDDAESEFRSSWSFVDRPPPKESERQKTHSGWSFTASDGQKTPQKPQRPERGGASTRQHVRASAQVHERSRRPPAMTSPKRRVADSERVEVEGESQRTVVVTVGQPVDSLPLYRYYFENERIGGGDVEEIEQADGEKGVLHVTFCSPDVARRVSQRLHTIAERQVHVQLYVPPKPKPTYRDKLLLGNVADETSRDSLMYFLENVTGMEAREILYGDEPGVVLVSFQHEPDLTEVKSKCAKKTLEGRHLSVSRVPISNCVLVENLTPGTTRDTIRYYFLSKKSRGGETERVHLETGEKSCRCYVYFEEHEVVDHVLSTHHVIDGRELLVTRYMECLGPTGGSTDPKMFTLPEPVLLTDENKHKLAFLRQFPDVQEDFSRQLAQVHAQLSLSDDSSLVTCALQPGTREGRALVRTWTKRVQDVICMFLQKIIVTRVVVMKQVWPGLEKVLAEAKLSGKDRCLLLPAPEQEMLMVTGVKDVAEALAGEISQFVKAEEDAIERRKQATTSVKKLKPHRLALLKAKSFHSEVTKNFPELTIEIDREQISFHGQLSDIKQAQVTMYDLLDSAASGKISDLTETQKRLLDTKETRTSVDKQLAAQGVVAVMEKSREELLVHAFSDEDVERAFSIIRVTLAEHVCVLGQESADLLQTPGWHALKKNQEDRYPGRLLLTPARDGSKIFLTSSDDILPGVLEDLQRFLQENTVYSETVRFPESRQKFISVFRMHELSSINKELTAYRVHVALASDERAILVKGTIAGLQAAKGRLQAVDKQTVCHEAVLDDSKMLRFLQADKCTKELSTLGRGHQCVVSFNREPAGFLQEDSVAEVAATEVTSPLPGLHGNMQIVATACLPSGAKVAAVQGDITQMRVDAIVNAANNRLQHGGGLAKVIVDRGGRSIQEECDQKLKSRGSTLDDGDVLETGPGTLPCRAILHAVGPVYRNGLSHEEERLETTVLNCLDAASKASYTSIALPAISTGVFGYPAAAASKVIVSAVKKYLEVNRRSSVRAVYLCHNQPNLLQNFTNAIHSEFPSARTQDRKVPGEALSYAQDPQGFKAARIPRHKETQAARPTFGTLYTPQGAGKRSTSSGPITISLQLGEIAKQKVDVIVNTAAKNLALNNGAVSCSVLAAAGAGLQQECNRKYPGGVNVGDVARTTGANLACEEVFHVVLCQWSLQHATRIEQMLDGVVEDCLKEAHQSGYTTIAFPVLGTGNLQYPRDTVARSMLRAIHSYQQANPSTSLREVRIIVFHKDKSTLEIFQQAQSQLGVKVTGASGPTRRARRNWKSGTEFAGDDKGTSASRDTADGAEFNINGIRLVVKQGDITAEAADVIVNSSNGDLDLNRGGVASALRDKCGPRLIAECKNKVPDMRKHGLAWTEAYGLQSRLILHVNAENFTVDPEWEAGIKQLLVTAESRGAQTIAMPALGTGAYAVTPDQSACFLYKALKKYAAGKSGKLQEVRVVLFDAHILPPFVAAVQTCVQKDKGGILNTLKGLVGLASSAEVVQLPGQGMTSASEVTLYVYAGRQKDVQAFLKALHDHVNDKFTTQTIKDKTLLTLMSDQLSRIEQVGVQHGVDVTLDRASSALLLHGLQSSVPTAVTQINAILRSAMLAAMVQWYYIEVTTVGTDQQPYEPRENQIIEDAFQNEEKDVTLRDREGKVYVIDFNSMKETDRSDPSQPDVDVIRKMKMKGADSGWGELPPSWGSMQKDDDVILVPLKSSDQEFKDVSANFSATLGNNQLTVKGVDRVQNPTLYRQYTALKGQMDRQNQSKNNEKTLWHGTSPDAMENINRYGFNRSYCGKNAVQYGQGVYFAVQSSYSASATYSPPDPASGTRYMYQCKVLVGHSTQGHPNMRVLPPRTGHIQFDSATDNVNNPWMYVIFNDTQAYPEYRVTFK